MDSTSLGDRIIADNNQDRDELRNDENHGYNSLNARKSDDKKSPGIGIESDYRTMTGKSVVQPERPSEEVNPVDLPELTIPNLLAEIKKNIAVR